MAKIIVPSLFFAGRSVGLCLPLSLFPPSITHYSLLSRTLASGLSPSSRRSMSRSALDRMEQKKAQEAFRRQQEIMWQQQQGTYVDPTAESEKKRNEVAMMGNSMGTFNLNKMLYNCIQENEYFQRIQYGLTDFQSITEEVNRKVTHVEPWSAGTNRVPSTAFCLLVRYCLLRLTDKQLHSMLSRRGSPHVRALGFLYLRVVTDHKQLWDWVEDYMDDDEEFAPTADPRRMYTMGEFIKSILTRMDYHNTLLPVSHVTNKRKELATSGRLGDTPID